MNDKNLEESNRVADLYGRPLGLGDHSITDDQINVSSDAEHLPRHCFSLPYHNDTFGKSSIGQNMLKINTSHLI